jgi:hypothetical protein
MLVDREKGQSRAWIKTFSGVLTKTGSQIRAWINTLFKLADRKGESD